MESQSYSPKCIHKKKYLQYYDKPMDLFVLVYDTNLERDIRPKNDVGRFYKHVGLDRKINSVIVFCDCPCFSFSVFQLEFPQKIKKYQN